jgi:transketolase
MVEKIAHLDDIKSLPHVLLAHTTFGKGVSFMENQIKWHYLPMSKDEYQLALDQIEILCVRP